MAVPVVVPRFNPNDDAVEVVHWHVADRGWVEVGQDLVDVESAKAVVTISSEGSGYLRQIAAVGATVAVGAPIAWLDEVPTAPLDATVRAGAPETVPPPPTVEAAAPAHFSPAARAYLETHQIDPALFAGMGLVSLPLLRQRLAELAQPTPPPAPAPLRTLAIPRAKRLEIERLEQGLAGGITSALTVSFSSAPLRQLLATPSAPFGNLHGQLLPLILHTFAQLLRDQPAFTASYDQGQIVFADRIDIGVAIDLEQGLKVPVIRAADQRSPQQLLEELLTLVSAYHAQRLSVEQLQGSTITVSDLSPAQILQFQPLINGPQAAILGIGGDETLPGHPMTLTLVFDHRVLAGRQVAQLLTSMKQRLLAYADAATPGVAPRVVELPATPSTPPPLAPAGWVRRHAVARRAQLPTGPFLLLGAPSPLRESLREALTAAGQVCIQVQDGPQLLRHQATHYTLNRAQPTAYRQLWGAIAADGLLPAQILVLADEAQVASGDPWASLAPLCALLAEEGPRPATLICVTQQQLPDPHGVAGAQLHATGEPLWSVPDAPPGLRLLHLDLQDYTTPAACRAILRELLTVSRARAVILRGGERWVPALLSAGTAPQLQPERLRGWQPTVGIVRSAEPPSRWASALAQRLTMIWQELLPGRSIGLHDPFLALGGSSLRLVQLWKRLQTEIAPDLTLLDLFRYPTIAQLCARLAPGDAVSDGVVHPAPGSAGISPPRIAPVASATGNHEAPDGALLRLAAAPSAAERDAVAIIGMACRFPGAADLEQFWELLRSGQEAIRPFSDAELRAAGVAPELLRDPHYVKVGATIPHADQFDAAFFGLTPRDAAILDPQTRLFLEVAWEAFEHAGYPPQQVSGRIGLFAGAGLTTYLQQQFPEGFDPTMSVQGYQAFIANDKDYLTTRVAYTLNLRGPCVTVQTACSSALVAIHMAKQSLLNGEADLALAGGVSVRFPQTSGYRFQEGLIFAPDGHCRAFDAAANGTVFGHGGGVVLLKRLREALADGDPIYAVVKGSAVNNDGAVKQGYTAPSIAGQAAVIRAALEDAQVSAATIGYVEGHGTGTPLGDPIEVTALTEAFQTHGAGAVGYCVLGSVKPNIGHLDVAAGVAGVIKASLALQRREIPPTLHLRQPNPAIAWAETPFVVRGEGVAWAGDGAVRRAGVSSFGVGGTNAHLILEEAPAEGGRGSVGAWPFQLLTLSAKDEGALAALVQRYVAWLDAHPDANLGDVSATTHVGRSHFAHRVALVAGSVAELREQLAALSPLPTSPRWGEERATSLLTSPRVAFLFTGQGAHALHMGRELFTTQPTFRATMEQCDAILRPILGESLLAILYPDEATHAYAAAQLARTSYAQPALFALEYAMATLWRSWGVVPSALLGHSLGEYVAACIAGVFSLADGLTLIAARGRLMERACEPGAMVWVLANEALVRQVIAPYADTVAIAGANSPENVVISGPPAAIDQVVATLAAQGVSSRPLQQIHHAFHSPLMEPMLAEFRTVAETITYHPPTLRLVANLTGTLAGAAIATADYWVRHCRETVRFADGVATLYAEGCDTFIELGPKPTLLAVARQNVADAAERCWLPSLRPQRSDWQQLLESLGTLYVRGATIDWSAFERDRSRRTVALPTYPFQRQRHWVESASLLGGHRATQGLATNRLIQRQLPLPRSRELRFELLLTLRSHAYIDHHRYGGQAVVPASTGISIVLSAVKTQFGRTSCVLQSVVFAQAMRLHETEPLPVQLILQPQQGEGHYRFELVSLVDADAGVDGWRVHATGDLLVPAQEMPPPAHSFDLAAIQARCPQPLNQAQLYAGLSEPSDPFYIGPQLHWGQQCWLNEREALCALGKPQLHDTIEDFQLHPGIIEGPAGPIMRLVRQRDGEPVSVMAFAIERYQFYAPPAPGATLWNYITLSEPLAGHDQGMLRVTTSLLDGEGRLLAEMVGFELRQVAVEQLAASGATVTPHAVPTLPLSEVIAPAHHIAAALAALPAAQQQQRMEQEVERVIRSLLGLPTGQPVDPQLSFFSMGIDSLLSVEVRNQVQRIVERPVPATIVFRCPTIRELSSYLLQHLVAPQPGAPPPPAAPALPTSVDAPPPVGDLHALTEADAEARLLAYLADLEREG